MVSCKREGGGWYELTLSNNFLKLFPFPFPFPLPFPALGDRRERERYIERIVSEGIEVWVRLAGCGKDCNIGK